MRPVISTAELADLLDSDHPPTVLDVRWRLTGPSGRDSYERGHVPEAVFVDVDTELSGKPGIEGRHPLPEPAVLQRTLRAAGVSGSRPVVVYDDGDGSVAARAWWLLRWGGHRRVAVLDGGFAAWSAEGRPVETNIVRPQPGDVVIRPGRCLSSMPMTPRHWPAAVCCSMLALRSGIRVRWNRWTRRPDMCPGRSIRRSPSTSTRTVGGVRPRNWHDTSPNSASDRRPPWGCTAGPGSRRVRSCSLWNSRDTRGPRLCTRVRGRTGSPTRTGRSPQGRNPAEHGCGPVRGTPAVPQRSHGQTGRYTPKLGCHVELGRCLGSALLAYNFGSDHPFNPVRLDLTVRLATALGVLQDVPLLVPDPVQAEELYRAHTAEYVEAVKQAPMAGWDVGYGLGTPDNPVFTDMHEASSLVVGSTLLGARCIAEGKARRAVNIAGGLHHAMRDRASGFCVYNDCVVAISWLLDHGFDRIAYIDTDVHHGDGVQAAFYGDPRVLTVSLHHTSVHVVSRHGLLG